MSVVTQEAKAYGLKLADIVYRLSFFSIAAYSGALIMLLLVAAAVAGNVVEVPEFHPK